MKQRGPRWVRIHLRKQWRYDKTAKLGAKGGFGEVFEGDDESAKPVAIKRLFSHLETVQKELENVAALEGRTFRHVMPILDFGCDSRTSANYIVMPRAERSLEQEIRSRGRIPEQEAAKILNDIVRGLDELATLELEGTLVHRDLKPSNILMLEGRWTIADFGLARASEAATRPATLNDCMSAEYAAPEQWRRERVSSATDVYALGCVGYCLLAGKPPFDGPNFMQQHCQEPIPQLVGIDPSFEQLLSAMCAKSQSDRPTRNRITQVLGNLSLGPQRERRLSSKLASAGARISTDRRQAEGHAMRMQEADAQRHARAGAGRATFVRIAGDLLSAIATDVPEARVTPTAVQEGGWRVWRAVLGNNALLRLRLPTGIDVYPADAFLGSSWDVLLLAEVLVR